MIDRTRLCADAQKLGAALTEAQCALADGYAEALVRANEKMNLTAITDPEGVERRHLLDCFACAALREISGAVADVGTGGGLPGIAVKIYKPECRVTFIDATAKKLDFVRETAEGLGLGGCEFNHARAEELGKDEKYRESFDTVTARAVAGLAALAEYCLPLVKPGGYFVAMKGPAATQELADARAQIAVLGGGEARVEEYALPDGERRALVVIKKISRTPTKYPRKNKEIIADAKKLK